MFSGAARIPDREAAEAGPRRTVSVDVTGRYSYYYSYGSDFAELLMPNLASYFGLEDVQGYDPFIPMAYARWLDAINGGPDRPWRRHFGLVNPRAALTTDPAPWAIVICHRALLTEAEKRWGIQLKGTVRNAADDGGVVFYEPPRVIPYISVMPAAEGIGAGVLTATSPQPAKIREMKRSANRLELIVAGALRERLVTIYDMNLPGWSATIDHKPASLESGALMRLRLPSSDRPQRVELRYWPPGLTAGLVVCVVSLLAWGALSFWRRAPWPPAAHARSAHSLTEDTR
jgi:hypothetical protein